MRKKDSFKKNVLSLAVFTIFSRLLGLFKSFIQAKYLGTGIQGDAFNFALTIPNLMRRLAGEGAISTSFIPIYVEYQNNPKKAREFTSKFFTMTAVFLFFTVVVVYVLAPLLGYMNEFSRADSRSLALTINLLRIMYPYAFFICLAALLQGILNTHNSFIPSSLSPIVFNLIFIASGLFLAPYFSSKEHPYIFALAVLTGGVFQIGIQLPFIKIKGLSFGISFSFWKDKSIRRALKLFAIGAFGAGIYQINVGINRLISLGSGIGVLSYLTFSNLLIELVQGIFIISLTTVLLPSLSKFCHKEEWDKAKDIMVYSIKMLLFFSLPAMVAYLILGKQIINILFERGKFDAFSTAGTYRALMIHSIGLPLISIQRVVSQAFYARKEVKKIVKSSFVAMIVNIVLALLLAGSFKEQGIAFAGIFSIFVNLIILYLYLPGILGSFPWSKLFRPLFANLFSSFVMAFGLWYYKKVFAYPDLFAEKILWLFAAVVIGLVLYLTVMFLTNYDDSKKMLLKIRNRF